MEISLVKIAEIVNGEIKGDPEKKIRGAAAFEDATSEDITLAGSAKYLKNINQTRAGAIIVPRRFQKADMNIVRADNPQVAFAKILNLFYPKPRQKTGVSSLAYTGKNFIFGKDISVAPFVMIHDNVTIGDRVTLYPGVVIENNVIIGNDAVIYPNVTVLERCKIGSRVTIHAGTVIGSDGFGFAPDGEKYCKIPQTGIVQIDDDVEIGAGNTIDRATFGKTWIKNGVKTDNLVHIAHNVTVDENCIIVAQVGISGSVSIGKNVILAGQAGIAGHLTIGDNAIVGPKAGVGKSVSDGEVVSGAPEMPHKLWLRVQRIIPMLPALKKKLSEIDKRLKKIEEK